MMLERSNLKWKASADKVPPVRLDIRRNTEHQKVVDGHFQSHAAQWRDVYEEESVEGEIYRKRLAIVLEWIDQLALPLGEQFLEIGCGGGLSSVALAQRGYVVQAMDSVPAMLNSTRESVARAGVSSSVVTSLGDAHSLAFLDNFFGLVLAIGVMPYLHSPKKALEEMARVLKPGGFLLVTAGNRWRLDHALDPWLCPALQPAKMIVRRILRRAHRPPAESTLPSMQLDSLGEIDRWLSSVGLTKVKITTVGFQPLFRYRRFLRELTSIRLNRWLQWLADHNVPGIRSSGMDYIVLARKGVADN
jgi:ubiquinone/menaquinone biosynthesis C-methylase UbiE